LPDGSFVAPPGVAYALTDNGAGGHVLTGVDGTELKFAHVAAMPGDVAERLVSWKDPLNRYTDFSYAAQGLARVYPRNGSGYSLSMSYLGGQLVAVTDSAGRTVRFKQYGDNLTEYTDAESNTWAYGYGASHQLTTIANPLKQTLVTNAYDALGRVMEQDVPWHRAGKDYAVTYSFRFRRGGSSETGPTGHVIAYAFDDNGRIIRKTDANGVITRYQYNDTGKETQRYEGITLSATGVEDASHARKTITDWNQACAEPSMTFTYDGQGAIMPMESPAGLYKRFTYDEANKCRVLTRSEENRDQSVKRIWRYAYDAATHFFPVSVDGPRHDVTDTATNQYDADHQLIAFTDAMGHQTRIVRRHFSGQPELIIDANGRVTENTYYDDGLLWKQTICANVGDCNATGLRTEYAYTGLGLVKTKTLPDNSVITYDYDKAGRQTGFSDLAGNRTVYTLDAMGNRIREDVLDAHGALITTLSREYDQLNRLIKVVDGDGNATDYAYDSAGNRISVQRAGLGMVSTTYDNLNNPLSVTDADGQTTAYAYDVMHRVISIRDARGLLTSYAYNDFGERISEQSPDRGLWAFTYDEAGNRISRTDARGVYAAYAYDALNRLTGIAYPLAQQAHGEDVSFIYDAGKYGLGRRTGMTDESGTAEFTYDVYGRLIRDARAIGNVRYVTGYAYDAASRIASITYPDGRIIRYVRDSTGAVEAVTGVFRGVAFKLADNIQRLPFGGPAHAILYGNGAQLSRTFTASGRPRTRQLGISGKRLQDIAYDGYDAAGNVTSVTDNLDAARSRQYVYDRSGRLLSATGGAGVDFTYDALGNRQTKSAGASRNLYTTDASGNRLLTSQRNGYDFSYDYDANGNVLSIANRGGTRTLAYNLGNRLREETRFGVSRYAYDGLSRRARIDLDSGPVNGTRGLALLYDQGGRRLAVADASSGRIKREYVYLNNALLALFHENKAPEAGANLKLSGSGHTTAFKRIRGRWRIISSKNGNTTTIYVDLSGRSIFVEEHQKTGVTTSQRYFVAAKDWRVYYRRKRAWVRGWWGRGRWVRYYEATHAFYVRVGAKGYVSGSVSVDLRDGFARGYLSVSESGDWWQGRNYSLNGSRIQGQARYKAYFYHLNHSGAPVMLSDETGAIAWRAEYEPFGISKVTLNTGALDQDARFPGQFTEPWDRRMRANGAREYLPFIGRYLQPDPIGLKGGLNPYVYAGDNPLNFIDPSGLLEVTIGGSVGGTDFSTTVYDSAIGLLPSSDTTIGVSTTLIGGGIGIVFNTGLQATEVTATNLIGSNVGFLSKYTSFGTNSALSEISVNIGLGIGLPLTFTKTVGAISALQCHKCF